MYLLDANVFIEAKNRHYGLDFCPAFWDWLIDRNHAQVVFSIEKVGGELQAYQDDLSTWAARLGSEFFLDPPDPEILAVLGAISEWVEDQDYRQSAKNEFLAAPDYFLIGHALTGDFTVVTHEKRANSTKRVKIPDVCAALGIEVATPFEMLRREGARFHLGPQRGGRLALPIRPQA